MTLTLKQTGSIEALICSLSKPAFRDTLLFMEITQKCIMHNIQLVDIPRNPPQKRYFLSILIPIGCQALLFRIFRPPLNKMDAAEQAITLEDYALAKQLAEQAQVDAQLASATVRSAKTQKAASALLEDNHVLRQELNRKTQ
jgi:hypothetical protein